MPAHRVAKGEDTVGTGLRINTSLNQAILDSLKQLPFDSRSEFFRYAAQFLLGHIAAGNSIEIPRLGSVESTNCDAESKM